jgi:hypothetical protein
VQETTIPKASCGSVYRGREHSIGVGVIVEGDEYPKKEELEHTRQGRLENQCGKRVLDWFNSALESINESLVRAPRWAIPEMRCEV